MQVSLRTIGNFQGILIPKPILKQFGLVDVADVQVNDGVIELRLLQCRPREG